jgi:hypothetical protein
MRISIFRRMAAAFHAFVAGDVQPSGNTTSNERSRLSQDPNDVRLCARVPTRDGRYESKLVRIIQVNGHVLIGESIDRPTTRVVVSPSTCLSLDEYLRAYRAFTGRDAPMLIDEDGDPLF